MPDGESTSNQDLIKSIAVEREFADRAILGASHEEVILLKNVRLCCVRQ